MGAGRTCLKITVARRRDSLSPSPESNLRVSETGIWPPFDLNKNRADCEQASKSSVNSLPGLMTFVLQSHAGNERVENFDIVSEIGRIENF